jgi:hypothetical protein
VAIPWNGSKHRPQTFLRLWIKRKKGIQVFLKVDRTPTKYITKQSLINDAGNAEIINKDT